MVMCAFCCGTVQLWCGSGGLVKYRKEKMDIMLGGGIMGGRVSHSLEIYFITHLLQINELWLFLVCIGSSSISARLQ